MLYSLSEKSHCRWKQAVLCVTVGSDYVFSAVLAISFFFYFLFLNRKQKIYESPPLFVSYIGLKSFKVHVRREETGDHLQ